MKRRELRLRRQNNYLEFLNCVYREKSIKSAKSFTNPKESNNFPIY